MKRHILLQMILSMAGWVILIGTLIFVSIYLFRRFRNRNRARG